ncbi:MAG: ATP-binding protein, partial [Lachnospira sp.]|nr:ATP-binding protein [Lachnospira sp.]
PKIYFVDHSRNKGDIKEDLILLQQDAGLQALRENRCIFDDKRGCSQCFECIGVINKKTPQELTLMESSRLLQYKLFNLQLNDFANRLNRYFRKNGARSQEIHYEIKFDADEIFQIDTIVKMKNSRRDGTLDSLGEGLKSIYILSLLETYVETKNIAPYIIMIEDPEIYLHPHLKKVASEILYRLSKKNQVIFSTHEPEMLFNFTSKQIRQVYMDNNLNTSVNQETDIDEILNDLGYTANDLMNVSFVFIVEGKQDRSRLPLLLNKYYSEIYDDEGHLKRIAIISTNSCTNIKTYANLKYINSLYIRDSFMMIRDSDGKDRQLLGRQLCKYYGDRANEDKGNLPRVTDKNVLILKYYSFENYFLFPEVMVQIGVIKSVDRFYDILWNKYREYLYKLTSVKNMQKKLGIRIESREDIVEHIEDIRIYVRGHNLYDIFYGRYKKNENEILTKYIEAAPREIFADILEKIDNFVFFDSRRR